MVKLPLTPKATQLIPLEKTQAQVLFWGGWVLTHALTVAGVTAVALSAGYIPSAIVGWIGLGISLSFIEQIILNRYTRLNYWGWATALGWLMGVPIGKIGIGWQAVGWDLDWALLGLSIGIFQALALRQQFRRVGWWLLASSTGLVLAGALGGATSLLKDWLTYKGFIHFDENLARILGLTLAMAVGGAVYGAVTGGWLLWFLRANQRELQ